MSDIKKNDKEEKKKIEEKKTPKLSDSAKTPKPSRSAKTPNASTSAKSPKKNSASKDKPKKQKQKNSDLIDSIDPELARQFKEKSQELKEKVHTDHLEEKLRKYTTSPIKAIIPACFALLLVLILISYFKSRGPEIDPDTIPLIEAKGEKAVVPEKSILPDGLEAVTEAFYTKTPENKYLDGGALAVERQKVASVNYRLPLEVKNNFDMHFRLIPDGTFMMGTPKTEKHYDETEFLHKKAVKRPFYLGKHEVTVRQWQAVMGDLPVNCVKTLDAPVTAISLDDCLRFLNKLNSTLPEDSKIQYLLPSESQWEYSCRAGTSGPYFFGSALVIDDYVVYRSNTETRNVMKVGSKKPNPWGLYDMLGNAAEWTRTPYFFYACNENHFAGIPMKDIQSFKRQLLNLTYEQKRDSYGAYFDMKMKLKSDEAILKMSCYDIPVYDGEHPENLIQPLNNFDVKTRTAGLNVGIFYYDINKNRRYDNNEPIWKDNIDKGKINHFDAEHDTIILSYAKEIPQGTRGVKTGLYFNDKNQSFEWDPGEELWAKKENPFNLYNWNYDKPVYDGDYPEDMRKPFDNFNIRFNSVGFNTGINFHDINDNQIYDLGEPIWDDHRDSGTRGVYDPESDAVIVSFGKKIPAGTKGRNNGLFFNDKNKSFKWEPGEEIWQRPENTRTVDYINEFVFRGGSYINEPNDLRSAQRWFFERQNHYSYHSFRVAVHLKVELTSQKEQGSEKP